MLNKSFKIIAALALPLLISAASCSTTKSTKATKTVAATPVAFNIDTIAGKYRFAPKPGHTIIIETLQVHLTHSSQPGVGLTVTRADGNKSNIILPQIANNDVYSFGGIVHLTLNSGDEAVLDAADILNAKPLQARFIISGTEQKNK